MGQNIASEITFGLIYFVFGVFSAFLFFGLSGLGKYFAFPRLITALLDVAATLICFALFFWFFIYVQDGITRFYEVVFFLLGITVYVKVIRDFLLKLTNKIKKSCPTKIRQLFCKINNFLKR